MYIASIGTIGGYKNLQGYITFGIPKVAFVHVFPYRPSQCNEIVGYDTVLDSIIENFKTQPQNELKYNKNDDSG